MLPTDIIKVPLDGPLPRKNLRDGRRFVIEGHVGTEGLHELDLFIRACGGDYLQAGEGVSVRLDAASNVLQLTLSVCRIV